MVHKRLAAVHVCYNRLRYTGGAHNTHLGGLVGDAVSRDLPRRVLAYPGLAEGVLHSAHLQPAVVHPQPDVLQPRVRLVEVVHLVLFVVVCHVKLRVSFLVLADGGGRNAWGA